MRDISQRDERRQWEAWGISVRRLRDIPRGVRAWLWARLEDLTGFAGRLGALSWRAGSTGLRTKAVWGEGRSGIGFLASHHSAGGLGCFDGECGRPLL